MENILIGLGSNIGKRATNLEAAFDALARLPQTRLVRASHAVETRPVGGTPGQGTFLNAAAMLETSLSPEALLKHLQQIEEGLGRQRDTRWGPRTIDLDILLYGDIHMETEHLTIPHPRMTWRRFVVEPSVEVAPDMVHPELGWTLARLLRHLNETPSYVAVAGSIGAGKSSLVARLAEIGAVRPIWEEIDDHRMTDFYADPRDKGWETECDFLARRAKTLDRSSFSNASKEWAMSDFWFDQSDAFAEVWLDPEQYKRFREKWLAARQRVVTPKLVVVLRAAPETLAASVARRNRPFESGLKAKQLGRIQDTINARLLLPDRGPRLCINVDSEVDLFAEVQAALDGMRKWT